MFALPYSGWFLSWGIYLEFRGRILGRSLGHYLLFCPQSVSCMLQPRPSTLLLLGCLLSPFLLWPTGFLSVPRNVRSDTC